MIKVTSTRSAPSAAQPSHSGVGGYLYQPETTTVEWSDGTRLVVEDSQAKAVYKGKTYCLPHLGTSIHGELVRRWTRAISIRLQQDLGKVTRLQDRLRNWKTDWPEHDPAA